MLSKVLFLSAILVVGEAGYVDTIKKCSIKDTECQIKLYESVLQSVAVTGYPELDIPVFDPYVIKNTTVNVMGLMDMTMVDGVVEGFKDMKLENYEINIEKGYTILDLHFDVLTIKGRYTAQSGPIVEKLIGNNVTADGNGQMTMEQVKLKFKFAFRPELREDGEIYLIPDKDLTKYDFDVLGGIKFEANNIKYGIVDISLPVINFLNKNWTYIQKTFSKYFTDRAVEIHYEYCTRFFSSVPAKNYLVEDLSEYIKN